MTASLSASAIKFYLAESTNKRGFGRLSMGSNWSILQERSYYVKAFWLRATNKFGHWRGAGSSSAPTGWGNARGRSLKKKKKTTSGERLQPEKVTPQDEYAAAVVCAASPSLRFPPCRMEMHNNSPSFFGSSGGGAGAPFHTLPGSRPSVEP